MRTIPDARSTRKKLRGTGAPIGRPRIEGLEPFNLRILSDQRDALERAVEEERVARSHPTLTVTDLIRESITRWLSARKGQQ